MKVLLWDQTWKYEFRRVEAGRVEVRHHATRFRGPWPVGLAVLLHQRYVLWACERYLNSDVFGSEDSDAQQEYLARVPLRTVQAFLRQLRDEKARALEAQRKDPRETAAAVARTEAQLDTLARLEQAPPPVAVARRAVAAAGALDAASLKLVAGAEMHEVLAAAREDARRNAAVGAAVDTLRSAPELEFQQRPRPRRISTGTYRGV